MPGVLGSNPRRNTTPLLGPLVQRYYDRPLLIAGRPGFESQRGHACFLFFNTCTPLVYGSCQSHSIQKMVCGAPGRRISRVCAVLPIPVRGPASPPADPHRHVWHQQPPLFPRARFYGGGATTGSVAIQKLITAVKNGQPVSSVRFRHLPDEMHTVITLQPPSVIQVVRPRALWRGLAFVFLLLLFFFLLLLFFGDC